MRTKSGHALSTFLGYYNRLRLQVAPQFPCYCAIAISTLASSGGKRASSGREGGFPQPPLYSSDASSHGHGGFRLCSPPFCGPQWDFFSTRLRFSATSHHGHGGGRIFLAPLTFLNQQPPRPWKRMVFFLPPPHSSAGSWRGHERDWIAPFFSVSAAISPHGHGKG